MAKISVLYCLSFLLAAVADGHQAPVPHPPSQPWQPGVIIPEIVASAHPEQSYVLYLPSKYSPEKKWPIVCAFDPAARGTIPVVLMKDAVARALNGNRKAALDTLRRAKQKTKDAPAFFQWLQAEPAFTKFRSAPEFAALLDLHVPQ